MTCAHVYYLFAVLISKKKKNHWDIVFIGLQKMNSHNDTMRFDETLREECQ
jgi:hypothetical protein